MVANSKQKLTALGNNNTLAGRDVINIYYYLNPSCQKKLRLSYDELTALIEQEVICCRNSTLFPWSQKSITYTKAFPNLFIEPGFEVQKTDEVYEYANLWNCTKKNLIFLGDAGAGKTTLLKYIFGFNEWPKKETTIIYVDARNLVRPKNDFGTYINEIINGGFKLDNFTLLLIDCIDEAFFGKRNDLHELLLKLRSLQNGKVWLGCRTDYFAAVYSSAFEEFADAKLTLRPWDIIQADAFIEKYSGLENCYYIIEYINDLIKENRAVKKFKYNPFHLSLLVFLAQNAKDENGNLTKYSIDSQYDLYDKFMNIWIRREHIRETSVLETSEIYELLYEIASYVYKGEDCALSDSVSDSAVRDLLVTDRDEISDTVYVKGFYHRSLSAFFLAHNVVLAMLEGGERLQRVLSQHMLDDVTNFVREAFSIYDKKKKNTIHDNLRAAYQVCVQETENSLAENERFLIREQVIYFITRLGVDAKSFISEEFSRESNRYLRKNLAYGAVALSPTPELSIVTLQYAERLTPGTEDEKILRSWTMAYFNDVDVDPYTFQDTEQRPWTNAKRQRLERFSNPQKMKDYRFFLFDVPLFYCFFENRGWQELNSEDLSIIKNISIEKHYYTDNEYDFLKREKDKLVAKYEKMYAENFI